MDDTRMPDAVAQLYAMHRHGPLVSGLDGNERRYRNARRAAASPRSVQTPALDDERASAGSIVRCCSSRKDA
jgi:hypothetical protein